MNIPPFGMLLEEGENLYIYGIFGQHESIDSCIVGNLLILPYFCRKETWEHVSVHWQQGKVFFKTRGHLYRLAKPTQRDCLSCLALPLLAVCCAAWPGKTNPDQCSRPVATSGCSRHRSGSILSDGTKSLPERMLTLSVLSARSSGIHLRTISQKYLSHKPLLI